MDRSRLNPNIEGIRELRQSATGWFTRAKATVEVQLKRLPKWAPWAIGSVAAVGVLLLLTRKASASSEGGAVVDVPEGEFERLISARGLDRKVVKAIMNVEASGSPFSAPGKPIVRFEPHVFLRYSAAWKLSDGKRLPDRKWPTSAETQADGITILLPGMSAPTRPEGKKRRGGQPAEWDAISRAASALNRTVAVMSASWGVGQVMGFNYKLLGYANPLDMEASFSVSAEAQKVGILNFLTNKGLSEAVKNRDWMKIGRVYNGDTTGVAAAHYKAAYDKLA